MGQMMVYGDIKLKKLPMEDQTWDMVFHVVRASAMRDFWLEGWLKTFLG
jgi:hypothetical protein